MRASSSAQPPSPMPNSSTAQPWKPSACSAIAPTKPPATGGRYNAGVTSSAVMRPVVSCDTTCQAIASCSSSAAPSRASVGTRQGVPALSGA